MSRSRALRVWIGVVVWLGAATVHAAGPFAEIRFHPDCTLDCRPTLPSMNKSWPNNNYPEDIGKPSGATFAHVVPKLWADRMVYWADDEAAQFFGLLPAPQEEAQLRLELRREGQQDAVASISARATAGQFSTLLDLSALPVGKYQATATSRTPGNAAPITATVAFEKIDRRAEPVKFPDKGIELHMEPKPGVIDDGVWPVRVGVPLPRGLLRDTARLVLFENDQPINSEIRGRATWTPGTSLKWIHVDFLARYRGGQPGTYRLRLLDAPGPPMVTKLKVSDGGERITVDTGVTSFTVNKRHFAGPEWKADDGAGGAYLVDESGAVFRAAQDSDADVRIEEQGPVKVTLRAEGWYVRVDDPAQKLCRFLTRLTAYAGEPMVRVSQQTYITYDTDKVRLADLGFRVAVGPVKQFAIGVDGKIITDAIPADGVFIHQDRHDRVHIGGLAQEVTGQHADGWATAQAGEAITVALQEIWQKYPKEIELTSKDLTLHFWPKHGHDAFPLEEELQKKNIYKFLCYHEGKLLDLKTPDTYFQQWSKYAEDPKSGEIEGSGGWWRESERDATKSANAQGVVISNEFGLRPHDIGDANGGAAFGKAFADDPGAYADPQWVAATDALGPMDAVDGKNFPDMEQAIEEGWLSWTRTVERYGDYGMFNYADTQTIALIGENRPGLHRVWQSSHYHNIATNWLLYARTGSPRLLRWARANTDHFMHVDMCQYADKENPLQVRSHELGAFQHMGWKQHWGSSRHDEAWGQFREVTGHFIDPDALLLCWYVNGNPRAKESYDLWAAALPPHMPMLLWGYAREINNTLANVITLYHATGDATLLPIIYGPAEVMRTYMPLEKQRPGPLWHPLWMNRYHELTRDPRYEAFITKYADMWRSDESTWALALAAKAYEITGDKRFLEKHLPYVREYPRTFFRSEGDPWDWWGNGPGPLGDNYAALSWGYFLRQVHRAGLSLQDAAPNPTVTYLCTPERFTHFYLPISTHIYVVKKDAAPLEVKQTLPGNQATSVRVTGPGGVEAPGVPGAELFKIERLQESKPEIPEFVSVPGTDKPGLFGVEYRGHSFYLAAPATKAEHEAVLLRVGAAYRVISRCVGVVQPRGPKAPVTLLCASDSDREPCDIEVRDANGQSIGHANLLRSRPRNKEARLLLDPAKHPLPWTLDVIGAAMITFDTKAPDLLFARTKADLEAVGPRIPQTEPAKAK